MRAHLTNSIENGIVKAGVVPSLAQALFVGLDVGEVQRIGGAQASVNQRVARLKERVNSLPRRELEVVLAFGADQQIDFKILFINGLAAARAFDPEALGADVPGTRIGSVFRGRSARFGRILAVFALKPGHTDPNCKWIARQERRRSFDYVPASVTGAKSSARKHSINARNQSLCMAAVVVVIGTKGEAKRSLFNVNAIQHGQRRWNEDDGEAGPCAGVKSKSQED